MKKMTIIFLVFLFTSCKVIAQYTEAAVTREGMSFELYNGGIIKSTFQPKNYLHNEQISNAVIAVPLSKKISKKKYVINSDGSVDYFINKDTLQMIRYFDSGFYKGFQFKLNNTEKISGTGERSVSLNRRGFKLPLYNTPNYGYGMNTESLNYSVPFIISSKGYGIFFDNPSRGYIDIGKSNPDILEYGASSGELTFYIIPGKNAEEILTKYQSLIGTQPIPARWVFGNLMSRFGYRSQKQLLSIADKMKSDSIPFDAVIIDLFWFGDSVKETLGTLAWNKKSWPQPENMIKSLKQQGIHTILITEPYVLDHTPNYLPSKKIQAVDSTGKPYLLTTFYFGNGGLLDLFRKDAQAWFWSKYKTQIKNGVAGWWGDLGEPETHPSDMYHNLKDFGFKRLFKADEIHNIYGHYWDKMLFDRYAKEYPDTRLFNLNRSGYAGSARYSIFPWSGDVGRNWSGLQAQLPVMIGMSLSGIPYIHADAGGFAGGDNDQELYTRWLQFATFTPVFRPHGTAIGDLDPNQLSIPSEAALHPDPYKSIVCRYIDMRYSLLPYNYTLAYEQAKFGMPLVHPLFFENNSDSNLYKAEDQFLWGNNILIAPVIEKNATERKLYLPEGKWYNYFTAAILDGKQWITQKVILDDIPVFIKEGSFIPMADYSSVKKLSTTKDYDDKKLLLEYYPSTQKTHYSLFLDDGKTNHTLEKNQFALIHFEGKEENGIINITISTSGNDSIKNVSRILKLIIPGSKIESASINNKKVILNKKISLQKALRDVDAQYIPVIFTGKQLHLKIKTVK
ncbi:MAG: TIM-barrel domain-containing protein [Ginsengibacter sp.]